MILYIVPGWSYINYRQSYIFDIIASLMAKKFNRIVKTCTGGGTVVSSNSDKPRLAGKNCEIAIEYNYIIFDEYLINIRSCRSAAGLNDYRRPHQKLKAGWYLSFQSMFLNLCFKFFE